jgi:hypothetical protein
MSPQLAAERPRHREFVFGEATLTGRRVELSYALRGGPDPDVAFVETLELPVQVAPPDPSDPAVLRLLDGVHRTFGVSYFKAAVPPHIVAKPVASADAAFWDALYTEGLGEFYFTNDLDPRGHGGFPRSATAEPPPVAAAHPAGGRVIVLVGGGKDSIVAREIVRHAGVPAVGLSLGQHPWIARSAEAMGLEHWVIGRRLDPKLADLNAQGAYNGHVPISACIAAVSMLVAYAAGAAQVVVANERTADEGNLAWRGLDVNHQFSKSFPFEKAFGEWCDRQLSARAPRYFSLLRPLSELRIAGAFACHPEYFGAFTSCNANFRLRPTAPPARWCGRCPKCIFAWLMLAPYLRKDDLAGIFGGDLLEGEQAGAMLERLAGVTGHKPFECVGTAQECRAALSRLAGEGRLPRSVAAWYERSVAPGAGDAAQLWAAARAAGGPHRIPPEWETRLDAYLGSHGA